MVDWMDETLYEALSPMERPDDLLNKGVLSRAREKRVKRYPAVAAAVATLCLLSTATVFAAWRYFSAQEVAREVSDRRLAEEFARHNRLEQIEIQSCGGYDVRLLGVVSGEMISDRLLTEAQNGIADDKTYIVAAISNADGTPMPEMGEEAFERTQFFVSPYVKGLDPVYFNAYYLGGGYSCFVRDGVQYRLLETNDIEVFADQGIYVGISDGVAYNSRAYEYDSESGEIRRNPSYHGVNALFSLPIDPENADAEKAADIIRSIHYKDNIRRKTQSAAVSDDVAGWINSITPDTIDALAIPVEGSRKTVSIKELYSMEFGEYPKELADQIEETVMELYFPNGIGMSEQMTRYATSWEDAWIETYTLNEDRTVTYLRYRPR